MKIKQILGFLSVSLSVLTGNCFGMNISSGNLEIYNDSLSPTVVEIQDDRNRSLHNFEIPANSFIKKELGFSPTANYTDFNVFIFSKPEGNDQGSRLLAKFLISNVTKDNNIILDIYRRGNIVRLYPSAPARTVKTGLFKKNDIFSRGDLDLKTNVNADNISRLNIYQR